MASLNHIPVPVGLSSNSEALPLPEGEALNDFAARVSSATLQDLATDFVFFNHGALLLFAGCINDPVIRWCAFNEGKLHGPVFRLFSEFPIFHGLEHPLSKDPIWNHTLVACPREDWLLLRDYLDRETILSRDHKLYNQPLAQEAIPCIDYLAMKKLSVLPYRPPMVDIHLYGVDSNRCCLHFLPALNPPLDKIRLKVDPPLEETVRLAQALLQGSADPYLAIGK